MFLLLYILCQTQKSLCLPSRMKDSFAEVWPSHGSFPVEPDLIDKLIEGARQIVDCKVTGTQTVHRDTPVMFYKFTYAGFICDI
ncbi:MAG: hypothetical protein II631_03885 [Treponema sp.]|nr:hypothetical protein [Treponema sp.]